MNVQELFRRLSYAELSNLSIGTEGGGEIKEDKQASLIHYTNEALLRLYSRFVLREADVTIICAEHVTNYQFLKKFAMSSTEGGPLIWRYIQDRPENEFKEDLIKVLAVYDRYSTQYPLNDSENVFSVFTPQPNVLQVPRPVQGEPMVVVYQARHPLIGYEDVEAEIEIPVVLEGALTAHIAHQVFRFMNGQENAVKAAEHLSNYEQICAGVLEQDLVNSSSSTTNVKFFQRGFR